MHLYIAVEDGEKTILKLLKFRLDMAQRRGDLTKEQRASVGEDPLEKEMGPQRQPHCALRGSPAPPRAPCRVQGNVVSLIPRQEGGP